MISKKLLSGLALLLASQVTLAVTCPSTWVGQPFVQIAPATGVYAGAPVCQYKEVSSAECTKGGGNIVPGNLCQKLLSTGGNNVMFYSAYISSPAVSACKVTGSGGSPLFWSSPAGVAYSTQDSCLKDPNVVWDSLCNKLLPVGTTYNVFYNNKYVFLGACTAFNKGFYRSASGSKFPGVTNNTTLYSDGKGEGCAVVDAAQMARMGGTSVMSISVVPVPNYVYHFNGPCKN